MPVLALQLPFSHLIVVSSIRGPFAFALGFTKRVDRFGVVGLAPRSPPQWVQP